MQEQQRGDRERDALAQAVERVIHDMVEALPPEQRIGASRQLRVALGDLLSTAPIEGRDLVTEIANRARLAAAFRVKLLGDDS